MKRPTVTPTLTPEERGKYAEERFFKAWANAKDFPSWMVSVERPTEHEDFFQKTDAVIVRIHGANLRIQIKSYWMTEEQRHELMQYGVIPISVQRRTSLRKIRKNTLIAFEKFVRLQEIPVKHSKSKKQKSPWVFYKNGRKRTYKTRGR